MEAGRAVELLVDGTVVRIAAGATILEACDAAGKYVPRLCHYPGLGCCSRVGTGSERPGAPVRADPWVECGLCVVRLADGSTPLACLTTAVSSLEVATDDPDVLAVRRERLARILTRHPHICLSCPDRDGCARDECSYGVPLEARCCDEFGRCELGRLVRWVDPQSVIPRREVGVSRDSVVEGRIRREAGLCVGCGRCVRVCDESPHAGRALEMVAVIADSGGGPPTVHGGAASAAVAAPKKGTLRASECTFCGQCVMVCPAGALTAPGEAGARWLAGRREQSGLAEPVMPLEARLSFSARGLDAVPHAAGVFRLFDDRGEVVRISGVDDLRRGLAEALADPGSAAATVFEVELDPLFTQRESELLAQYVKGRGHLPPGNDLGDDLFDD
jgi:predicted molibdopterin-dependent oxidoreductase YjgC